MIAKPAQQATEFDVQPDDVAGSSGKQAPAHRVGQDTEQESNQYERGEPPGVPLEHINRRWARTERLAALSRYPALGNRGRWACPLRPAYSSWVENR